MPDDVRSRYNSLSAQQRSELVDQVAQEHARRSIAMILQASGTIGELVQSGKVGMIAAMYHTHSGTIDFLSDSAVGMDSQQIQATQPGEHSLVSAT